MNTLVQLWFAVSQQWAHLMLMWSWQAALLVGALLVIARIRRSASASSRYHLWLTGVLALAVLPLWDTAVRSLPIRQPLADSVAVLVRPPVVLSIPAGEFPAEAAPGLAPSQSNMPPAATLIWGAVFLAWCAGVGVCAIAIVGSYRRLRRLRRTAAPFPPVRSASGVVVPVGGSAEVLTPQLAGIRHPMILLPLDIEDWSTREERRGVLLHEVAHLERRDHYVSLFLALLGSVFFFHPLVRYCLRQLAIERELACDEMVASAGIEPDVYAEAILKVAERCASLTQPYEVAFGSSRRVLERRMAMILNGNNRRVRGRGSRVRAFARAAVMFGVITWLFLPSGDLAAQLQDSVEATELLSALRLAAPTVAAAVPPAPPLAAAIAPATTPVPAQQPALASLTGRVYDQSGARIPGVAVSLTSGQTRLVAVTNVAGAYTFADVTPGQYVLEAALPGFQTIKISDLLMDRPNLQRDLTLRVGSVVTQVQVTAQRAQAAAIPPPTTQPPPPPIRIGGDISQANLIYSPKPTYPASMRAGGIQGDVMIQAIIGVDGSIITPQVLTTNVHPDLAAAALNAVKVWRYKPTMLNGVPIEVITTITVGFGLTD